MTLTNFNDSISQLPAITMDKERIEELSREKSSYWSIEFLFNGSLANSHLVIFTPFRCSMCSLMIRTIAWLPVPAYLRERAIIAPVITDK